MNILLTGGAGYIGSHTIIELYKAGHTAVVVDNLSNSSLESLRRVAEIIGVSEIPFYEFDIRNSEALEKVFAVHQFGIFFSGLTRSLVNSDYNLRVFECKTAAWNMLAYTDQPLKTFDKDLPARHSQGHIR